MSNTTPPSWLSQAMNMTPSAGPTGTMNFFRPSNSQMLNGAALQNYLTPNGAATTPDQITNRTVKFDGGLTREMIGNGFGQQMTGIEDLFNQYGSLGGLGGIAGAGNNSAVYRPNGQAITNVPGQAANGAQTVGAFGSTNPFNATF